MDYKKLGTSDLLVSPVCVGCMSFGERFADFHEWTLNQDETMAVVKHALDLGINFFDTANCYAHGTSEEFLGRAIKASGVARDKVVIATKVYFNEGCLSKAAIERENVAACFSLAVGEGRHCSAYRCDEGESL